MRHLIVRLTLGAAVGLCVAAPATAQNFPTKPITIVVGSTAGGAADFGARVYAEVVGRSLGQRIVIDNRQGGGGIVAAQYAQQQPADGYTLVQVGSGLPEALPSMQNLPFDAHKDFTYVTPLFQSDNFFTVRSSLNVNSMQEFAARAKATQGGLSIGDTGIGGPPHLMMEMYKLATGAPFVIVHYRASQEIQTDIQSDRVDASPAAYGAFRPSYEVNKLKILAVANTTRSKRFPNVPTYAEAGFGDIVVGTWWGLLGPKNIPKAVVDRLYAEFEKASRDPDLIKKLEEQDIQPFVMAPDKFLDYAVANEARFSKPIKQLGIKVQ